MYSIEITGDVATGAAKDNKEIDAKKLADMRSVLALFKTEKNIEHRRRMVENYMKWSLVTQFGLLELL